MIIEDHSSCDFIKNEKSEYIIKKGLKVSKKNIVFEDAMCFKIFPNICDLQIIRFHTS